EAMVHYRPAAKIIIIGLITLQAIAVMFVSLMFFPLVAQWHTLDLSLYYNDSRNVLQGLVPYRDFAIEYPPLALLPFTLPHLAALQQPLRFSDYIQAFLIENVLFSTLIALALGWMTEQRAIVRPPALTLALYTLFVALSAPLLPWRYDLFPALLTMLAFVSVLRGRPAWAGFWGGLGIAAKLYPVVLLPIFGLYYLAGRQYRGFLRMLLGSALAVLLVLLPFLLAFTTPAQLFSFLSYHSLRGLQIESLPAGAIVLAHTLGLTPAKLEFNYGALHLDSPWASAALAWLPYLFVVVFSVVAVSAWGRFREECAAADNRRASAETLAAYIFAALLAFIATNKVFSPQYIIWLLPFAPLLRPPQALIFLAIVAMTITLFPFNYDRLLAMQRLPVVVLNLRNLLVIVLLAWLVIERAPASARSLLP
ncbi:MAG TPA: glycosyltransferase family 87 protein, partial [Gammaproteobacteria bacterium]|nr:glycosyltransferase family 87 protein [Gammaproteobacteria bacterium]